MYSILLHENEPTCPVSRLPLREEPYNAALHAVGLLLFAGGTALLVVIAALESTAAGIVGAAIFGASLVVLYGISTLYHSLRNPRWKRRVQVADHIAIYMLIAGTYTPFTLVTLGGGWGWSIFGVVWGMALFGTIFKLFYTRRFTAISTGLYVLMGWTIIIAIGPLVESLMVGGLVWLVVGGVAYTLGAAFYLMDERRPFFHTIFHGFVLAGSFSHFWAVLRYVLPVPQA